MEICRCESLNHDNHKDKNCEQPATERDGLCKECHDEAREEFLQTTKGVTELPPSKLPPTKIG